MYTYLWYFFIAGILGWCGEVLYAAVKERKYVNRGFLNSPICPIYGVGCVAISFLLKPFQKNMAFLIIGSILIGSAIEWITGFILEKVFKQKWWDYSDDPHNLNGYICLKFSLLWGIAGAVVMRLIVPVINYLLTMISRDFGWILLLSLAGVFIFDLMVTVIALANLNHKLKNLEVVLDGLKNNFNAMSETVTEAISEVKKKYGETHLWGKYTDFSDKKNKDLLALKARYEKAIKKNRLHVRLLKAFPDLKFLRHNAQLEELKKQFDIFYKKSSDILRKREEDAKLAYEPQITEGEVAPFANGICFEKLFWVFVIGSFIGFIIETIWCFVLPPHVFEWRVSVVLGPFILIYGVGAVAITLCLYKLYRKKDIWIFLFSMVIGGTFEYLCSFAQQVIFGTVSWQYDDSVLNIHGRTNLMFSFFWGILGLIWIKDIFPRISKSIERIPPRIGRILTICIFSFMLVNIILSAGAVARQSERINAVPAVNAVQTFFDLHFSDDFLKKIYPNMQYVGSPTLLK